MRITIRHEGQLEVAHEDVDGQEFVGTFKFDETVFVRRCAYLQPPPPALCRRGFGVCFPIEDHGNCKNTLQRSKCKLAEHDQMLKRLHRFQRMAVVG